MIGRQMTTSNETEKKPLKLSRPGRLEIKKTIDAGQVRQSFPHGRTKTVAVEVKKKRTFAPGEHGRMTEVTGDAAAPLEEALSVASALDALHAPHLTADERATRIKALEDAKKDEERRRALEVEMRRKAEEEAVRRQAEEAEERRQAEERARIEAEARTKLDALSPKAKAADGAKPATAKTAGDAGNSSARQARSPRGGAGDRGGRRRARTRQALRQADSGETGAGTSPPGAAPRRPQGDHLRSAGRFR